MPPFGASLQILDDAAVVVVKGEVDLATAPDLAGRLEDAIAKTPQSVIVDLSKTSFFDCSGMHVIAEASKGMTSKLVIRHPRPFLAQVLRILDFDDFCVIED
jgi:anti-sigma B factor antagonist